MKFNLLFGSVRLNQNSAQFRNKEGTAALLSPNLSICAHVIDDREPRCCCCATRSADSRCTRTTADFGSSNFVPPSTVRFRSLLLHGAPLIADWCKLTGSADRAHQSTGDRPRVRRFVREPLAIRHSTVVVVVDGAVSYKRSRGPPPVEREHALSQRRPAPTKRVA